MNRLHLQNKTHFIEYPDNATGKLQITAFRRSHKEFKGCHIKEVLQLRPNDVRLGEIYELK